MRSLATLQGINLKGFGSVNPPYECERAKRECLKNGMREGRRKKRRRDENWKVRRGRGEEAEEEEEEENSLASIRGKRRPSRCRPMKMDGGSVPERDGEIA